MVTVLAGSGSCDVTYAVRVVDRFGAVVADANTLTTVEWTRVLNDTSTARVVVKPDGDCCAEMGNIRTWGHSLYIYRNGNPVWTGPILAVDWRFGEVEINAGDISAWLARRVPHQNKTLDNTDIADIAQFLIDDGFMPDDPGHAVNIIASSGVKGGRTYTLNVGQTLDHLMDLADSGIDWTVLGDQFIILPDNWNQSIGNLTDGDMPQGLIVAEDGTSLITRWVVAGGTNHDQVGEAGGTSVFYGLLERYTEQTSVVDPIAATAAAQARLAASNVAPVFIDTQEVTIAPDAPINVDTLTPGWSLDIATISTCRDISQRLKITGLKVLMDESGVEKVQVQVAISGADL